MRLHWKRRGAPNSKSSSRSASSPPKIIGDGLNLPKLSVSHSAAADAAVARSKQPCNSMTSSSAHSVLLQLRRNSSSLNYQRHSAGHTHGIKKNVEYNCSSDSPTSHGSAVVFSSIPVHRRHRQTVHVWGTGNISSAFLVKLNSALQYL